MKNQFSHPKMLPQPFSITRRDFLESTIGAGFATTPRNFGVRAYNVGFAPRLGVAYQLQPKTVIRAGFARSFNAAGVGSVFAQNPEIDPLTTTPQQFNSSTCSRAPATRGFQSITAPPPTFPTR